MDSLIAVTGASGGVGSRVATRLAARGARQRLVVRDPARAPEVARGEVRVSPGYGDGPAMRAALEGADRMFLIPAEESRDRVEQHATAIEAAVAAGVRHITYLSFVNATAPTPFGLAAEHGRTEERVRATGIGFSFLRMNLYMDFMPFMVGADGVIRGPAGNGRIAAVARDDVADAAAAVLTEDGHDGATYDLTGPEALTLAEVAERLAAVSGKAIRFHDETREEAYASRAGAGEPWEIENWVGSYLAVAEGALSGVSDAVGRLTGHEPISLDAYARAHPQALAHVSS